MPDHEFFFLEGELQRFHLDVLRFDADSCFSHPAEVIPKPMAASSALDKRKARLIGGASPFTNEAPVEAVNMSTSVPVSHLVGAPLPTTSTSKTTTLSAKNSPYASTSSAQKPLESAIPLSSYTLPYQSYDIPPSQSMGVVSPEGLPTVGYTGLAYPASASQGGPSSPSHSERMQSYKSSQPAQSVASIGLVPSRINSSFQGHAAEALRPAPGHDETAAMPLGDASSAMHDIELGRPNGREGQHHVSRSVGGPGVAEDIMITD